MNVSKDRSGLPTPMLDNADLKRKRRNHLMKVLNLLLRDEVSDQSLMMLKTLMESERSTFLDNLEEQLERWPLMLLLMNMHPEVRIRTRRNRMQ